MTVGPDDDFAAAEFALGTLSPSERATLAARRLREPDLDEAIRAWEERLAPLAEAAPPIEPPRDHLPAIEARIRQTASPASPAARSPDAALAALRRSVARWRAGAIAASCLAGLLAVGFAARETRQAPHEYVAILQKDAASPAFEVTVDLDRQELRVRPVAAKAPPGKDYELWIIDAKSRRAALARRDRRGAALGQSFRLRPRRRRSGDLCGDGRAARRIARRQAVRPAGVRRQAHSGWTVRSNAGAQIMGPLTRCRPRAATNSIVWFACKSTLKQRRG